jgi:mono/diheme cytochrome c family protein
MCHGADGTMGTLGAKDLSKSAMSNADVLNIISNGKAAMPAYSKTLSAEDIALLAGYVEQLRK